MDLSICKMLAPHCTLELLLVAQGMEDGSQYLQDVASMTSTSYFHHLAKALTKESANMLIPDICRKAHTPCL